MRGRKIIWSALVFLLLGAIVNVAVAWGCGLAPFYSGWLPSSPTAGDDLRWWRANAPAGFEAVDETESLSRLAGFGRAYAQWPTHARAPVSRRYIQRERTGWPALSMEQSHWRDWVEGRIVHQHAWKVPFFRDEEHSVPLRPLWPGFAINTLFYAAILWLLFAAPFSLRRRRRISRGLCPACAYPIGTWGGEVCTECGRPIARRSAV